MFASLDVTAKRLMHGRIGVEFAEEPRDHNVLCQIFPEFLRRRAPANAIALLKPLEAGCRAAAGSS
jgi:hypothetical protein